MTYDSFKSHKNQGFTFFLKDTIFEKLQVGGSQTDSAPPVTLPAVLGLISLDMHQVYFPRGPCKSVASRQSFPLYYFVKKSI